MMKAFEILTFELIWEQLQSDIYWIISRNVLILDLSFLSKLHSAAFLLRLKIAEPERELID